MITIVYAVELINDGYAVWRKVGAGKSYPVNMKGRLVVHKKLENAEEAVESARRADIAAATRLGVIVSVVVEKVDCR